MLTPEVLAWSQEVEDEIVSRHGDEVRPLLTMPRLLSFLGKDATPTQVVAGSELLPPYLVSAVVGGAGDVAVSTYGVDIDDVAVQRRLIQDIEKDLPAPPDGFEVEIVGLPVVASGGLDAMSSGRFVITAASLAVAALAIGLWLRSRRLAAMVVAVSAIASGWLYLALHLVGAELNPLTIAVGALVTVVACEFTVMLDGAGRERWLGRSVALAAGAGTAGYLCLALSELAVLRSFGVLLAGGVLATYLAARLVVAAVGGAGDDDIPAPRRTKEALDDADARERLSIRKDARAREKRSLALVLEELR